LPLPRTSSSEKPEGDFPPLLRLPPRVSLERNPREKTRERTGILFFFELSINKKLYVSFLWHLRLDYINKNKMMRMGKSGLLPNINSEDFNTCKSCIKGKMISKSFSKN
jgi:hypothetical protein